MKRCSSCNMLCEDYATVCSRCGKRFDGRNAAPGQRPGGNQGRPPFRESPPQMRPGNEYAYSANGFDHTLEFSPEEISKGKPLAMVTYLFSVLGIFLGLLNRRSEYVQFHVRQNLKYMVLNFLVWGACLILSALFAGLAYMAKSTDLLKVAPFFLGLAGVCSVAIFIMQFICFIWVCQGKAVEALLVRHFRFMS